MNSKVSFQANSIIEAEELDQQNNEIINRLMEKIENK